MKLTPEQEHHVARTIHRAMNARGLHLAGTPSWWERLLEGRFGIGERWQYRGPDGRWHRYWRRNGEVPDAALPDAFREEQQ